MNCIQYYIYLKELVKRNFKLEQLKRVGAYYDIVQCVI